jgi:hypothetical protein
MKKRKNKTDCHFCTNAGGYIRIHEGQAVHVCQKHGKGMQHRSHEETSALKHAAACKPRGKHIDIDALIDARVNMIVTARVNGCKCLSPQISAGGCMRCNGNCVII